MTEFWREHCRLCENARPVPPPGLARFSFIVDYIQAHYCTGCVQIEAILRLCKDLHAPWCQMLKPVHPGFPFSVYTCNCKIPSTGHPHPLARRYSILLTAARRIMALSWAYKHWARKLIWPKL